jgi:murein DD-endopeptidase MepM/ murein hydrolase activator NlpD
MQPTAPNGRGWRKLIAIAAGMATAAVGAGVATAAGGGGIASPDPPVISGVVCISKCAGERQASVGARVRLEGRSLDSVSEVKFASANRRIAVTPATVATTSVEAKVPEGAVTGTVRVVGVSGDTADTPEDEPLEIVDDSRIPQSGDFKLTSAAATPHKTFYDGVKPPRVNYLFQGARPTDVQIEVVDRETAETVASFLDEDAQPATENRARWDGRTSGGGLAPNGKYKFRIGSVGGGKAETTEDSRFGFYRYRFPIAGKHDYGDGFGAGRNHQGQDVFARCGTTLRAARGGRVKFNKVHASAGNYLVIDGKGTGMDFMYAHMAERSPLKQGARVKTGQKIGQVGETGNASGCHLHFEAWSAPGWYDGGEALSKVTKLLKSWDRWS